MRLSMAYRIGSLSQNNHHFIDQQRNSKTCLRVERDSSSSGTDSGSLSPFDIKSKNIAKTYGNETYDFWESKLSIKSFNMDLHNLALDDPQKAQDALEIMEELYRQSQQYATQDEDASGLSQTTVQPDTACYTTVLEAWLDAGDMDAAQALLDRMEQRYDEAMQQSTANGASNVTAAVVPTELTYMLMAQGWANDAKNDISGKSAERAEAILQHMQQRGLPPTVKIYSVVLEGWCKRAGTTRGAMKRADALLRKMETSYLEQQKQSINATKLVPSSAIIRPNVMTYTSYIGGLSRSRERDLATQAEAVLDRMAQYGVQPDMVAYTSVLNCWSKAVSRRERDMAATRALQILQDMERMYLKEMYHVKPSLITYSTAIGAIGNSLDPKSPQLAEGVLKRMYELSDTGAIANLKPTTQTYNAVLHALSRAPHDKKLRYARRAEQIISEMIRRAKEGEKDVQPNVRTWAAVLRAWARCGAVDAAENAQRVLDRLEEMNRNQETTVRPNFVCYTTVMGAWGSCRRRDALDKMEKILRHMEEAYEETLEADVRPNTVSYVTAIDSFVRRNEKDAAQRAQATVDRMLRLYAKGLGHVRPTRVIFNCLIHAYSKSREPNAASKAEQIFKWMESQYRGGDDLVRPDEVSLCGILNAWANQGTIVGAERTQQIWERMESLSVEERGFDLTVTMPNIVIKALARTDSADAVKKAEQILIRLEKEYKAGRSDLRPDVTTASSVINAAAYYKGGTEGRAEALDIALRTFERISQWPDEEPNNITYGTLFKAIANLMPVGEEREDLVRSFFDRCCDEGYCDGFVLSQVRHASMQLYRDLVDEPCGLGGPDADTSVSSVLRNIPFEWSANVVE